MKMLSEGAEARVFETRMFGMNAVAKIRHSKRYRIKELDIALRKSRTRKEARAMYRASEAGVRAPQLLGVGQFSIFMERLKGKLLKDVKAKPNVYVEIGKTLAKMHAANVIHGDFTPANIVVEDSIPYVIDFGLADINESVEDKAIDLLLMKRSISKKDYAILENAYSRAYEDSRNIILRLAEIETRGRYQIRTLT